jgi:hypothetical protein
VAANLNRVEHAELGRTGVLLLKNVIKARLGTILKFHFV